ncbi:MAG TPA: hypothetical protein VFM68_00065 [Candidatus Saccharimonadales bacterium]|nr:hypothetical protein [Candidatus Saccharimonadales bacterium]
METTNSAAEAAGAMVGSFVIIPLIVLGLTWVVVRIAKKRNLTKKGVLIALGVGLVLALLSSAGRMGA